MILRYAIILMLCYAAARCLFLLPLAITPLTPAFRCAMRCLIPRAAAACHAMMPTLMPLSDARHAAPFRLMAATFAAVVTLMLLAAASFSLALPLRFHFSLPPLLIAADITILR